MLVLGPTIQSGVGSSAQPPQPASGARSGWHGRQKGGPVGRIGDAGAEPLVKIAPVAGCAGGLLDQDPGQRSDVLCQPVLGLAELRRAERGGGRWLRFAPVAGLRSRRAGSRRRGQERGPVGRSGIDWAMALQSSPTERAESAALRTITRASGPM